VQRKAHAADVFCFHLVLNLVFDVVLLFSQYVQNNKSADNDWFRLESNKEGTRWFGKCWHIHNLLKYEFEVEFDVSRVLQKILTE